MVAISLYRGNLHRVPNVPRRWVVPTPKISLKDFRILLNRRSRALSRLHSPTTTTTTTTTSSNPNPKPNPIKEEEEEEEDEDERDNNVLRNSDSLPPLQSKPPKATTSPKEEEEEEGKLKEGGIRKEEGNDQKGWDGGDGPAKLVDGSDASKDKKPQVPQGNANLEDANGNLQDEKAPESLENTKEETSTKVEALTDKEMRKKEVEEKLVVLNEKKHNLVQVLKQILNAEEELKRRNSTQGTGIRTAVPLQVDVTNDSGSGSLTRLATPRLGSEGNLGGNMEGGEADDASNHSMHPRHLPRMSSTSPHSDSPHRRPPAFSAVPHPSRATLAVASSPSRFAPTGYQVHPVNPPMVSVSGTSYIASSPSPAASGGTSSFRDARLPSPWN